jgi:dolichol-phosphate mannosyltransferase
MSSASDPRALVVLPTYNEAANLGEIVRRILAATGEVDILVVDDNSPDGTGLLANELAAAEARVSVLHRPGKSGLGKAYRAGFAQGIAHGYEVLVEMDADGSHLPEQLPTLLAAAREADVVLGSRWMPGGSAPNWALRRRLLSRGGSVYARIALGLPFSDITGGFRVFRAAALEAIDFETVEAQGYCFQIEMLWRAFRGGLSVREIPITFAERLAGSSKMSGSIVFEAISRVTVWGVTNLPRRAASLLGDGPVPNPTQVHRGLTAAHPVDGRD